MKKLLIIAAVIFAGYLYFGGQQGAKLNSLKSFVSAKVTGATDSVLADAYAGGASTGQAASDSGAFSQLLAVNGQILVAVNNLLNLKRDSNRDMTVIRDGVEAIGVA